MLADLNLDMKRYYQANKFYSMTAKNCRYPYIRQKIDKINNTIIEDNIDFIEEFKRMKKYNFIICGRDMDNEQVKLLETIGYIKGCVKKYTPDIGIDMLDLDVLCSIPYDYIVILERNQKQAIKMIEDFTENNINESKIFNYYSYSYPYYIDGFDTKMNNFLFREKVELLIMGLSYAEVGINCDELPVPSFNFALSGQDIFYDYHLTKYLLNFDSVKNHLKQVCISMGYYAFDYDLSRGNQAPRIHRYYYTLGETHHYDNVLHLRLCHSNYKSKNYEADYYNYHNYKLNTVLNHKDKEQQDIIARKQATMNYPETVKENKKIFEMNLKMLNEHNIKPTIVILPTSKYYYKHFSDNYQKNKFYRILNELNRAYSFEVVDYFNSPVFEDEDFWDYSHLNKRGASKFTSILKNELSIE